MWLRAGRSTCQSKRGLCAARIVHAFVKMLGLKLNRFQMVDPNTFYLVNGVRRRWSAVQHDPDVLQYQVWRNESGRSAGELKNQALQAVGQEQSGGMEQRQPLSRLSWDPRKEPALNRDPGPRTGPALTTAPFF